ncbi:MAG TPA: hypothetical protein VH640_22640 [Bryobacteraceae bacterium]|jgi:hypothetical protein
MENRAIQLILHIDAGPEADQEDQALLTQRLRHDLLDLDVESVDPIHSGAAPGRAKGDPVTLTTLAVTLAPIALTEIMKALQTWLSRHERATVSIESDGQKMTVTGSPSKEQQQAIEAFLGRHRT